MDTPIRGSLTITYADRMEATRRELWGLVFAGGVFLSAVACAGLAVALGWTRPATVVVIGVMGLLMWLVLSLQYFGGLYIQYRKIRAGGMRFEYEFDANAISVQDGTGTRLSLPWSLIQSGKEFATGFSFSRRKASGLYFHKRAFAPEDLPRLRRLLAEKLGASMKLERA